MTTSTPHEDLLAARLHSLVDTIDGPAPTEAVVRRGRAAVRRNRVVGAAAALSVMATVGALGVTSGLLDHADRGQRLAGPAGASKTLAAVTDPKTHGKKDGKRPSKSSDATTWCNGDITAFRAQSRKYDPTRATYRDLVAEHLDPQHEHLQMQAGGGGQFSTGKDCVVYALGTRIGWTSPGDPGLGLVSVEVTTDWGKAQTHLAHGGWHPASSLPAGAVDAYVADYAGGTAVAVTRADGTTVALDAGPLFGNNSLTPVKNMDVTTDELLATAADPRFQMP